MIIEYELNGSQLTHKGIFDTHGFWVRFEPMRCDINREIQSYNIYGHFSFTYETKSQEDALKVFNGLLEILQEGHNNSNSWHDARLGYIKVIRL